MKQLLLKNFSWSFAGNFLYSICQWLLLISITQFGSAQDAGIFSFGLALSAPFVLLINLNFGALQSTNLTEKFGFHTFALIRILGNGIFLLIFFIIILFTNYEFHIKIVLLLIAISKSIESMSDLYYGLFQYRERLDLVSKSTIIRGSLGTLLFAIAYFLTTSLSIALLVMTIIWLLNLLLFDLKHAQKMKAGLPIKIEKLHIVQILKIGIPLGIVAFFDSLHVNIPRIALEKFATLEQLGYFGAVFYLVLINGRFMTAVGNTILPRLAKLFEEKEMSHFFKIVKFAVLLVTVSSFFILIVCYFFGSMLLAFFYGKEYSHLSFLLILIMIYSLFNYLGYVFETALNATKAYDFRLLNEIVSTIIIIICSICLIPLYGVNGAAVSLIICAFIKCLVFFLLFIKRVRKDDGNQEN